ncbi:MAG: ATP-binding protein [Clostridiales bacterium]|nr:ATP-binding protein [Clostridiales bacterium]
MEIDEKISSVAAYIASMDPVMDMLKTGYPSDAATRELDSIYEIFSDINGIMVYDANGLRFYHSNRETSGETLVEGEETAILNGSEPYITTGYGTQGTQRRAFHAVTDSESGRILGFVMVSVFTTFVMEQIRELSLTFILILGVMLVASVLLSLLIVRMLSSRLMGHHPVELLDLYKKQDVVLNALTEGLVAADSSGSVIFVNHSAAKFFPSEPELSGRPIDELIPAAGVDSVLKRGDAVFHRDVVTNGRRLLVDVLPIQNNDFMEGVLMILNDRTEMESLIDELSGTKSMLDTLRDLNHEFLNKLHVILGYLQTGETEQVMTFIINSTLVSSQAIRQTADRIRVSQICALVIGKMMHAAELGISLNVLPDSRCVEKELLIPIDAWITIVGNLLENAIEELVSDGKELKTISLGIFCTNGCNIITCEDTGRGIPESLRVRIFEKGVSSKGSNRGTGLYLIHNLVEQYDGTIEIETEEGEGSCFTLTFTDERARGSG